MQSIFDSRSTMGQWVTSLAISVVCCAILFVVFAGYLMGLHDKQALMQARLEVVQERQNQISSELVYMRRSVQIVPVAVPGSAASSGPAAASAVEAPAAVVPTASPSPPAVPEISQPTTP